MTVVFEVAVVVIRWFFATFECRDLEVAAIEEAVAMTPPRVVLHLLIGSSLSFFNTLRKVLLLFS